MPRKTKDHRAEGLINAINCARWLVHEFESLDCASIAKIFQRAVDDADTWVQTMAVAGKLPREVAEPIKAREASLIHNLLVKYASIEDPEMRNRVLDNMMASLKEGNVKVTVPGKQYERQSSY